MVATFTLGYYPWLTQHVSPAEIDQNIRLFATKVEEALQGEISGAKVVVTPPVDVPQQIDRICATSNSIELMNPLGLVFAREKCPVVEAVAIAQRIIDGKVGVTYFAQLYTNVASGINTIVEAKKKSVGYGVPYSTSNFLIPALILKQAGIHPLIHFTRIEFLGGHELVAQAVYNNQVVLGAGHDGVIVDLSNQPGFGDAKTKLKTLLRSPPIPSDPVAVNIPDSQVRAAVQEALVRASITPEGQSAIAKFWGNAQGLATASSDAFDSVRTAVETLNFEAVDLLAFS